MAFRQAVAQAWPPFVLVAGLLLVGLAAHAEGAFEWAATRLERFASGSIRLFAFSCGAVALVTAVLNLDTAVVFLTPVLVLAARQRELDERPFLYAAVFMANASSLFLPGSNLTNLLVLGQEPVSCATFAARLLAPASAATLTTACGLLFLWRRKLAGARQRPAHAHAPPRQQVSPFALTVVALAATLTLVLHDPAVWVLCVGLLAGAWELLRGRMSVLEMYRGLGAPVLLALFFFSVALGLLARQWAWPAHLVGHAGRSATTAIAAVAAVSVNNLPAALLLSARTVAHPRALLLGLNLGPNIAVTGSLSAYLWYRAAQQTGTQPSIRQFTRHGVLLAPAAMLTALLAITLLSSPS